MRFTPLLAFSLLVGAFAFGEDTKAPVITDAAKTPLVSKKSAEISAACVTELKKLPGKTPEEDLKHACSNVAVLEGCQSTKGKDIFYFEKKGTQKNPKKIFAKALIHGDETTAGVVARAWMERLDKIDPRNTWRVIPIANPDGTAAHTRYNANGVDLNRNFPTADWENQAIAYWKKKMKSDKRRYPGPAPESEIETRCLMKQFADFQPDFIISIHTPLGVLDLDGPKLSSPPAFRPLPWQSLGNFPGSLGRYMWADRNVPVLTIELKHNQDVSELEAFDKLQDISGTVAIQADRLKEKSGSSKKKPSDPKVSKSTNQSASLDSDPVSQ
jgi:murein peptide amidase A